MARGSPRSAASRGPRIPSKPPAPGRLLVIDDDLQIVELVADYFVELGYEVLRALEGDEGLRLVEASAPDVVLLDITMPGKNGEQVLRELRNRGYRHPIIMFSGNGDEEQAARTLQRGAFDYVAKPFDWSRLQSCVELAIVVARVGGVGPWGRQSQGDDRLHYMHYKGGWRN